MTGLQQCWKTLNVSLVNKIMTITMNKPKVNAMSIGLLEDLDQAFDHASKNDDIRGVHLRSNFSSTFSAGLDLSEMYERCSSRHRPTIEKFMFHTVSRGISAPFRCTKPVACSLDGHAIAGGIILALACDYISIGTRKSFLIGLTELLVGVPFPALPLKVVMHQLDPQLAHRLTFDANTIPSTEFSIRCERGENPDDLSMKWLKIMAQRPLKGFEITKKKWWNDIGEIESLETEQQKKEYIDCITGDECLQAMKQALKK